MSVTTRWRVLALSVGTALTVAACGSSGGEGTRPPAEESTASSSSSTSTETTAAPTSSSTTTPPPSGCTPGDMARDLGVTSVGGVECVEDWALAGVCSAPDPIDCVDTTRLLHLVEGRWADVGYSLQTCVEELVGQGVPEAVAARFEGFTRCFDPEPATTPTPSPSGEVDCGVTQSGYGEPFRVVGLGIGCDRANAVLAAYFAAPDKQGSSGHAEVEGFACFTDAIPDPRSGDVVGECTGAEGSIELRVP